MDLYYPYSQMQGILTRLQEMKARRDIQDTRVVSQTLSRSRRKEQEDYVRQKLKYLQRSRMQAQNQHSQLLLIRNEEQQLEKELLERQNLQKQRLQLHKFQLQRQRLANQERVKLEIEKNKLQQRLQIQNIIQEKKKRRLQQEAYWNLKKLNYQADLKRIRQIQTSLNYQSHLKRSRQLLARQQFQADFRRSRQLKRQISFAQNLRRSREIEVQNNLNRSREIQNNPKRSRELRNFSIQNNLRRSRQLQRSIAINQINKFKEIGTRLNLNIRKLRRQDLQNSRQLEQLSIANQKQREWQLQTAIKRKLLTEELIRNSLYRR